MPRESVVFSASEIAKRQLLLAAIRLFAEKGVDAVSLRTINREAGARNNSALHYHFGSKLGVIEAVINFIQDWFEDARSERLAKVEELNRKGPVELSRIFEAFLAPYIELLENERWGYDALRTLARFEFDGDAEIHAMLNRSTGKLVRRCKALLFSNCPGIPQDVLLQRFNFCANSIIQAFANSGNLHQSYLGDLRVERTSDLAKIFLDYCAAGMSAPVSDQGDLFR